ncbi:MAG: hypothetical protein Q4P16_09815 [Spirochaetales bacterium]|nr:hypothetical protein [Spirochaetales bacterium]
MPLTSEEKKLMFQIVNCTKYLSPIYKKYSLKHNLQDNNWYFKKNSSYINSTDDIKYYEKATDNFCTKKHNLKYELKEKKFKGVVVRIRKEYISTILGVYKNDDEESGFYPKRLNGCYILVATVFFGNGLKRIVPLDCIKEYKNFSDGNITKKYLEDLDKISENKPAPNVITTDDEGNIQIKNSYYFMDPEKWDCFIFERYLILNIHKRSVKFLASKNNEWFSITDEEYSKIMDLLKSQIKNEYGFIPKSSYGQTNFDKLVNFTKYPFAPELNEFSMLFNSYDKNSQSSSFQSLSIDENELEYKYLETIENNLKYDSDGIKKFILFCGLPYNSKNKKIFLQGHRNFAQYLGILHAGFRNEKNINKIIEKDVYRIFSSIVFTYGEFCKVSNKNDHEQNPNLYLNIRNNILYSDIAFLFRLYNENIVAKLVIEIIPVKFFCQNDYSTPETLEYMKILYDEGNLQEKIINKIGNEGLFSEYSRNLILKNYINVHPEQKENFEL